MLIGVLDFLHLRFPIQVPAWRRIDPSLREYCYFLHNLDPARYQEGVFSLFLLEATNNISSRSQRIPLSKRFGRIGEML